MPHIRVGNPEPLDAEAVPFLRFPYLNPLHQLRQNRFVQLRNLRVPLKGDSISHFLQFPFITLFHC
jgi:hypothetical protein